MLKKPENWGFLPSDLDLRGGAEIPAFLFVRTCLSHRLWLRFCFLDSCGHYFAFIVFAHGSSTQIRDLDAA